MKYLRISSLLFPLLTSACSVFGAQTTEIADYSVLKQDGDFEIRQYPTLVVVKTKSSGSWEEAQDDSFNRLFSYINGKNRNKRKIAMTAPVFVDETQKTKESSSKIAMTAPVFLEQTADKNEADKNEMAFVLPSQYTLETAPVPTNEKVSLAEMPAQARLVYTFSGILSAESIEEGKQKLTAYAKQNDIAIEQQSIRSAGYNPPWTIPFLRRNEILADVTPGASAEAK